MTRLLGWLRRRWFGNERRPYDWSEETPELRLPAAGHVRPVATYRAAGGPFGREMDDE
jgi:hypothetical protein